MPAAKVEQVESPHIEEVKGLDVQESSPDDTTKYLFTFLSSGALQRNIIQVSSSGQVARLTPMVPTTSNHRWSSVQVNAEEIF